MSSEKHGRKNKVNGFSMIEALVGAAILSFAFAGVSSIVVIFGARMTESIFEQKARADVNSIMQSFSIRQSCNKQIEKGWGKTLPIALTETVVQLQSLYAGPADQAGSTSSAEPASGGAGAASGTSPTPLQEARVGELLPGHTRARLKEVKLEFAKTPNPYDLIIRAQLSVQFQLDVAGSSGSSPGACDAAPVIPATSATTPDRGHHPCRRVVRSLFFHLNQSGQIESCADSISYNILEWQQQMCRRVNGVFTNGECNLEYSYEVKKATCLAIGLDYSGGRFCEIRL